MGRGRARVRVFFTAALDLWEVSSIGLRSYMWFDVQTLMKKQLDSGAMT